MDARIKALWTDALRSGRFTQGRGTLKTIDIDRMTDSPEPFPRHCCLGVLCEVLVSADRRPPDVSIDIAPDEIRVGVLTGPNTDYYTSTFGDFPGLFGLRRGDVHNLMSMNDGHDDQVQRSFAEIADWIDSHIEASPDAT